MKQRRHIVITGTGRAGTTFLIELLTNLGLDTGFDEAQLKRYKNPLGRAGLEYNVGLEDCPYIVKHPSFCDYADEIIARDDVVIEHIFVPIRELYAAAESRRVVARHNIREASFWQRVKLFLGKNKAFAGGLLQTNSLKRDSQERVLLNMIYKLMLAVSDSSIDITLINFPRCTTDAAYLFDKLKPALKDIEFTTFVKVFNETVRLELVHSYS